MSLLTGCASTPQTLRLLKSPPAHLQTKVEIEDTPFFPQRDYQCGPAALATMLDFRDIDVKPDDLTEKVYIPQRKGSLQLEMIAAARSYGLLAYKLDPQLNSLIEEINHGNPVLVFQNLSLDIWPLWHYAVVVGYDLSKAELILRSGAYRRHSVSFSTFEHTWRRAKYWAYVFTPAGKIPHTANPLDYTQATHALQQSGHSRMVLSAFRQGAIKWPEDPLTQMALGNAEFSQGNHIKAETAFRQVLKLGPENANAWNNLAYVLANRNCKAIALKAVACAVKLSPEDNNYQQSNEELQNMKTTNTGRCAEIRCPIN